MRAVPADVLERCPRCQGALDSLYLSMRDRLFHAPGERALASCGLCSLVWLIPRPSSDELPAFYSTYFTHGDETVDGGAPSPRNPFVNAALTRMGYDGRPGMLAALMVRLPQVFDACAGHAYWLPRVPNGTLLDVGCGDGRHLRQTQALGWRVTGLEPDPVAAEVARTRFGLDVRTDDLGSLPDASFDAIVMHHVVEHLPDHARDLRNVWRVLRPGGRCVIVTPNTRSLGRRIFGRAWVHWDPPRHLQLFCPSSLRTALTESGLVDVRVWTTARNARFAGSASLEIGRSTDERATTGPPSVPRRVAGLLFQILEHALLAVDASAGEEVVATGQRADGPL